MAEQPLAADRLRADPRVIEARRLLHEAVGEHRASLHAARGADSSLAPGYQEALRSFGALRGAPLVYPYIGSGLGNGALVELADGSVKIDLISGIGVHGWGHSDDLLLEAGIDAALEDICMQGNLQQNRIAVRLSEDLLAMARRGGAELAHCFFTSSGAMANENGLKMAFQRRAPADRLLAFSGCFAGRTLGMAHVTDKPSFRDGLPQTLQVDYLPFYDPDDDAGSTERSLAALQHALRRYPGRHAACMFELVQGEAGYWSAPPEFFRALMSCCREAGIAVHVDEVQSFARLEQAPFAFQALGLDRLVDIVSIGKITQVCATLFSEAWKPRPGLISQTFTSSTAALHACQRILAALNDGGFYGQNGRIAQIRQRFVAHLQAIAERHPDLLGGPFGTGAMIACTPLGGAREAVIALAKRLFDDGVIAFIAGADPCRLRFLPPIGVVRDADIDRAAEILEGSLQACGRERAS